MSPMLRRVHTMTRRRSSSASKGWKRSTIAEPQRDLWTERDKGKWTNKNHFSFSLKEPSLTGLLVQRTWSLEPRLQRWKDWAGGSSTKATLKQCFQEEQRSMWEQATSDGTGAALRPMSPLSSGSHLRVPLPTTSRSTVRSRTGFVLTTMEMVWDCLLWPLTTSRTCPYGSQ